MNVATSNHGAAVLAAALAIGACVRSSPGERARAADPLAVPVTVRLRAAQAVPPVELFVEGPSGAQGQCTAWEPEPGAPGTYSCTPKPFVVGEGSRGRVAAAFSASTANLSRHRFWTSTRVEFRGERALEFEWREGDFGLMRGRRPDGGVDAGNAEGADAGGNTGCDAGRGGLSKDAIGQVIRPSNNQMKSCYERELGDLPELRTRANSRFQIAPDGEVSGIAVELEVGPMRFAQCIGMTARALRYPPPQCGGIVYVTFPWVFQTDPANAPVTDAGSPWGEVLR